MKIKDYKCTHCYSNDFMFMKRPDKMNVVGIYCTECGAFLKWADKNEKNLMKMEEVKKNE